MSNSKVEQIRRRPEQARSRDRVDKIMQATRELITERGLDPVTMTDIAARAAMAVTALYRYFPNKQAVLRELAVRVLEHDRQVQYADLFSSDQPIGEQLREACVAYKKIHRDEPFRLALRTAIRTDATLAKIDHEDSVANARAFATVIAARTGRKDLKFLERHMLLTIAMLDATIHLGSHVSTREANVLMNDCISMVVDRLERSQQ